MARASPRGKERIRESLFGCVVVRESFSSEDERKMTPMMSHGVSWSQKYVPVVYQVLVPAVVYGTHHYVCAVKRQKTSTIRRSMPGKAGVLSATTDLRRRDRAETGPYKPSGLVLLVTHSWSRNQRYSQYVQSVSHGNFAAA
jgi:hypothetical protein